jgi:hypothetical protein
MVMYVLITAPPSAPERLRAALLAYPASSGIPSPDRASW